MSGPSESPIVGGVGGRPASLVIPGSMENVRLSDLVAPEAPQRAKAATLAALTVLHDAVTFADWDGEGASAISERTFDLARKFIAQMPSDALEPDVDATPQGEVEFTWEGLNGLVFSVLVLPSGGLGVAGLFGEMYLHGNAEWDGLALPDYVLDGLKWWGALLDPPLCGAWPASLARIR